MAKETHIIRIDEATAVNTITLRTLTTNVIRSSITAATTSGTINISSAVFTSGIVKVAFAYKSGDIAITINGTTVVTANGTFTFDASLNRVFLGGNNTTSFFNDRIRAAALYTTRLSDADLMLLTMPGNNTYLPQAVWNNYLSRTGNTELPDCLYTRHADLLDV